MTVSCQVPLQYSDPDGEQAAIAIIMFPSNFSSDDENYLGPILFNPGGPGSPCTEFILEDGELFREVLGPGYDLVGFDPRGECFNKLLIVMISKV